LVTTLLVIGAAALALGITAWLTFGLVINPLVRLAHADAEVKSLERAVAEREGQVANQQDELTWRTSTAGSAAIPISKGYVKPGEHALRVQVVPPNPAAAAVETAPAPTPAGNQRLFWGSLIGAFCAGFLVLFVRWRLARRRADGRTLRSRDRVVKDRHLKTAGEEA
jgi:hypothetical protein